MEGRSKAEGANLPNLQDYARRILLGKASAEVTDLLHVLH